MAGLKTDKSRELFERSKKSLAGGVSSNIRSSERPVPLFFERGIGSHLLSVFSAAKRANVLDIGILT